MVTVAAARFLSEEPMLGSIEPGKYADLVVLHGDCLAVPDEELDRLRPVVTIAGGQVVVEDSNR
jgi:predicted amidohydrolase YtcJ